MRGPSQGPTTMLLYPDTNIFLHYRRLDEIDWCAATTADQVTLVVAQVVIRELEQHKYQHPVKRIRRRAERVVSFLHELLSKGTEQGLPVELRQGVSLDFQRTEPRIDFAAAGLVATVQDDHLIASVLALLDESPDADARIVAADLGLRVKAFQKNIQVMSLPEDLRIGDAPDPRDQRIADLQQQLARHQQALPDVGLMFDDGERFMKFSPPTEDFGEREQREALERVQHEHPKMAMRTEGERRPRSAGLIDVRGLGGLFGAFEPSADQIERFNEKLDKFYADYADYLKRKATYQRLLAKTIPVAVCLENAGTAPADDVDVFLDFPEGLSVFDADDFPKEPDPPSPPERPQPRSPLDLYGNRLLDLPHLTNPYIPTIPHVPLNVTGPSVENGEQPAASFHVRRLKHNQREQLDELRVVFPSDTEPRSFSIGYRVHVGNLPDEIRGKLHVAVEAGKD